ncbi:class E sortase [Xylanimonas sp. McL0601]|uniref:class E sortase n=1 Tax=Xylanimonas sp. McL0601 TaxID=3414739 RepID=UPI003CE7681B
MSRRRRGAAVVVLSLVAELLLTTGGMLGLYTAWDVWWNVRAASAQADRATDELTDAWAAGSTPDDAAVGVLHVPRFGEGWARAVYPGTTRAETLDPLGVGHYDESAGPGEIGNFALAGHRSSYSRPFHDLHTLRVGDALIFESEDTWYVYEVTVTNLVIDPSQSEVLAPVFGDMTWQAEPTERTITLTSCHPVYSRHQRIVAHGVLTSSTPKEYGVPAEVA